MMDPTGQVCDVPTVAFDAIARLASQVSFQFPALVDERLGGTWRKVL